MSQERLMGWLRNQIGVERADGSCVRFELRHLANASRVGQEVLTVDAPGDMPSPDWYESAASQFESSALADAQAMGGPQTYAVFSYREKRPDKVSARVLFRVDGGDPDADSDYGHMHSEPATGQGLLRQLMRHNEAQQKSLVATFAQMLNTSQRVIARLSDQVDKLHEQRIDTINVVEDLLSQRHERDLATHQAEERSALMRSALDEVKLLIPAVVHRMQGTNGKALTDGSSSEALMLKRFFESLSPEQRERFMQSLSQTQQIALGELVQTLNGGPQ